MFSTWEVRRAREPLGLPHLCGLLHPPLVVDAGYEQPDRQRTLADDARQEIERRELVRKLRRCERQPAESGDHHEDAKRPRQERRSDDEITDRKAVQAEEDEWIYRR